MDNLHHDLTLDACVTIRESCPVEYAVDGPLTEFSFGSHRDGLRVAFDTKALGTLVRLGSRALAEQPAPGTPHRHWLTSPWLARSQLVVELVAGARKWPDGVVRRHRYS